jgi:hypothetical protein
MRYEFFKNIFCRLSQSKKVLTKIWHQVGSLLLKDLYIVSPKELSANSDVISVFA